AEEATFAGDPRVWATMRDMITAEQLDIEIKRGARLMVPNRLGIIKFSNDEHVVQTALGDRRYCVTLPVPWHQNDSPYWVQVYHQIENGGVAAMLHDLLAMDLGGWNHRRPPESEGLRRQRALSRRHTLWGWWETVLRRGYLLESEH